MKKTLITFVAMSIVMLAGCSDSAAANSRLVNTQEISISELENISIYYTSENVTFFQSTSDKIILKEYMNVDKPQYYALISQSDRDLQIAAGERPTALEGGSLHAKVEIYLPAKYQGGLNVETYSGAILSEQNLALYKLQANSKSGSITFGDITGTEISVGSMSGSIRLGAISGKSNIETTSGSIFVADISNSGSFISKSGDILVACNENVGDLRATAVSGSIALTVPENVGFQFYASTTSGNISTPFSQQLKGTKKEVTGTIGTNAEISMELTTTSGNIKVK